MRQIRRSDTVIPVLCAAVIIGWLAYNKAGPTEYAPDALQQYDILGIRTTIPYGFLDYFERAQNGPPGVRVRVQDNYYQLLGMGMVYPEMRYKVAADFVRDENRDLPKENMRVSLITTPGIPVTIESRRMEEEYAVALDAGDVAGYWKTLERINPDEIEGNVAN